MRTAYQYRLCPTPSQVATMRDWLDLLRRQYNYRLGERFHWYERNRCDINACPLICHIPELKDNPDFYSQKRDLVTSKVLFPEYGDIPSQVLQNCIERVKKTFDRWLKGDSNGKKSGKPRFKGIGRYRSFTFPQIKQDCIADKFIKLPSFGDVKLIQHRPLPDGFQIKTASIVLKSDGWYVVLSLQDTTVPVLSPDAPEMENTIGIDLGLKSFLTDDSGEEVAISRHYRRAEKRLKRLQRGLSRKKKGSNRRKKAIQRVSKAHLKVSNQRKDFHYKTAQKLLHRGKHVAHEKLNIKGLARTRLAKSINDAGWNQFLQILSIKAENGVRGEFPTSESGTPQGDVISPLLANIVLHGLENVGHELRYKKIGGGNIDTIKGFRYADDVVFILKPGDDPEFLRTYIDNFLVTRGLKVKEVKTKVLHSTDGFDFFGWDFKVKPNGKFISTPSQKATSSVKAKVKEVMKDSRFTLEQRIDKCGSIVRGWRNCHRFCDMSQHDLWATAYWTWKFIRKQGRYNRCQTNQVIHRAFPFVSWSACKFNNVKGEKSPYDGDFVYWSKRENANYNGITVRLLKKQNHKCTECNLSFISGDIAELHHIDGNHDNWKSLNLEVLHRECHQHQTIHGQVRVRTAG